MIAFGTAVTDLGAYERYAEPGIQLAGEPDSEVLTYQEAGSIFRNYNICLEKAAAHDDLEALVLLHQDAEIADPEFCTKVRAALDDPDVAIAGCAGAVGVRSLAWWEGAVTWASFTQRYPEMGGGDIEAFSWTMGDEIPAYAHTGEVDAVDGLVLVLSPWAVRELRFDESLGTLHGYDFDLCMQARAAGKKVVTADLRIIHHHSLELVGDREGWIAAHVRVAEKWDGYLSKDAGDWRQRALRAEADAAAAKAERVAAHMQCEARDRVIDRIRRSASWRLTAPLRWLRRPLRRGG